MKTSTFKMIAVFAAASLFASVALAKNGNGGGNNGGNHSNGGFKISFGGNPQHQSVSNNNSSSYNKSYSSGHCYPKSYNCYSGYCYPSYYSCYDNYGGYGNYGYIQPVQPIATTQLGVGQAFEPFHSNYVVLPGDTFFEVSLKEFGTSSNAPSIALFNNLPQSAALTPGQVLQMPSISVNGQLSPSRAPIAESLQGASNANTASNFNPSNSNLSIPSNSNLSNSLGSNLSSTTAPAVEAPRPKVTVGSTLLVDGQTFGDKPGAARLKVGGAALKVEVVEWTGSAVKIRLPQLDLASAMNADIEVVRADGSLASKTPVELGAATEVALAK